MPLGSGILGNLAQGPIENVWLCTAHVPSWVREFCGSLALYCWVLRSAWVSELLTSGL